MQDKAWEKIIEDPQNPENRKKMERIAEHIIQETEQICAHIMEWLPNQKELSPRDIEMFREIDDFNEKIVQTLFHGLVVTRHFGAVQNTAPLLINTPGEKIMKDHGWQVLDIEGALHHMDRNQLQELVICILEAADQGLNETGGYLLRQEKKGLLALEKEFFKKDDH